MGDRKDMDGLDAFFDAARDAAPLPSEALMARILADAEAEMPRPAAPVRARRPLWGRAVSALGGWRAVAGLGVASMAGLGLGLWMPGAIGDVAQGFTASPTADYGLTEMSASFYDLAMEGGV